MQAALHSSQKFFLYSTETSLCPIFHSLNLKDETDVVIAGMIAIGVMGILIDSIFILIERRAFQWQSLYR